jgi:hypothetical protein
MKIFDFVKTNDLESKTQHEKAKLLSYYHYKERGETVFTMALISELMVNAGFNAPHTSRLKESLTRGNREKVFIPSKTKAGTLEFIPFVLQEMESSIGKAWKDTSTVISDGELIDEIKFCGKRDYLTRLIKQINSSYKNNCYDACAVLMRRVFEILLISSYQEFKIDDVIKSSDGNYFMLERIVKDAKNNTTLKLSRIKNEFDTIREIGNNSAHSITYTAGQKDIKDIKNAYRLMLDELYNKAGLFDKGAKNAKQSTV